MKRQTLLAVLCLTIGTATAQADDNTLVGTLGVQGGGDFASASADPGSASSKTGWFAGIFTEMPVSGQWFFQPEVTFMKKQIALTNQQVGFTYKMTYLQIPLLVKYKCPSSMWGIKPALVFGPETGIRLKSEYERARSGTVTDKGKLVGMENTNIAATAGVEFGFDITSSITGTVGGRYSWGFLDIDTSTQLAKTRDIQALGGLMFKL